MIYNSIKNINTKNYDVCIIGSGFAGLELAKNLNKKLKIAIIEAGSLIKSNNNLFNSLTSRHPLKYYNLTKCRTSKVGGSSHLWGGSKMIAKIKPLSQSDFLKEFNGIENWPKKQSELKYFEKKVMDFLNIKKFVSKKDKIINNKFFNNQDFQYTFAKNLSDKKYLNFFRKKKNIDFFYNTTCTDCTVRKNKIINIKIIDLRRKELKLTSKFFVMACGAIENSRLILNWAKKNKAFSNKNVGKNFMEHLMFLNAIKIKSLIKIPHNYFLSPKKKVIKKFRNYNFCLQIVSIGKDEYMCHIQTEIKPNKNSKIKLIKKKDNYGNYYCKLNWDLREYETNIVLRIFDFLKKNCRNQKFEINFDISKLKNKKKKFINTSYKVRKNKFQIIPFNHHLGLTKMSNKKKFGVVDKNLKFFNIKNLYLNSSGNFPTGGYANPTFTLLQMTYSLANHLNNNFK